MLSTIKNTVLKLSYAALMGATIFSGSAGLTVDSAHAQMHDRGSWFVIAGCFRNYAGAQQQAGKLMSRGLGAVVINTNNWPNFRNGYFCAASDPVLEQSTANFMLGQYRGVVRDAYVKSGL